MAWGLGFGVWIGGSVTYYTYQVLPDDLQRPSSQYPPPNLYTGFRICSDGGGRGGTGGIAALRDVTSR